VAPRPKKTQNRQAAKFSSPNVSSLKPWWHNLDYQFVGAVLMQCISERLTSPIAGLGGYSKDHFCYPKKMCRGFWGTLGPTIPPFGISECQICKKRTGLLIFCPKVLKLVLPLTVPLETSGPAKLCQISACKRGAAQARYMLIDVNVDMSPILYTLKV